jgi:hypothetical protein
MMWKSQHFHGGARLSMRGVAARSWARLRVAAAAW